MEKTKIDIDEVAKIMEENEIGDLKELRKLLGDYDTLCNDVFRLTYLVTFLNSFLDKKEMREEAKKFVKKCMDEQFGNNNNNSNNKGRT